MGEKNLHTLNTHSTQEGRKVNRSIAIMSSVLMSKILTEASVDMDARYAESWLTAKPADRRRPNLWDYSWAHVHNEGSVFLWTLRYKAILIWVDSE